MAISWSSQDFAQELADAQKLFAYNPAELLHKSLLDALMRKAQNADSLQASEYVATLEAVDHCSLGDTAKQDLQNQILNRACGSNETSNKLAKVPQTLTNPGGYLTKPEIMNLMQGNIKVKNAPTIIAKRLKLAGLTSLKECTKKACLGCPGHALAEPATAFTRADLCYGK